MAYRLELLGRVQLLHDGRPVESLAAHRQKLALLAYLALQEESRVPRERLVGIFWPDRDASSARHSLSELVYELRREVGDLVETTRTTVGLASSGFSCDVREFRRAAETGDVAHAVELYEGNFLEGFNASVSTELEHWAESERSQLQRLHRKVCREAVASLKEQGAVEAAVAAVRRWLATDPFEDEAHHCLIELLALSGDRSGALEQFERYAKMCEELEVQPLDETRALVKAIRSGGVAGSPAASRSASAPGPAPQASMPVTPPVGLRRFALPRLLHVVILYAGLGWAALRVCGLLIDRQVVPPWVLPALWGLLAVGFPLSLALTWAGERRRAGLPLPAWLAHPRWPAWARSTHGGHVRGALGALVLVFLSWLFLLENGWTDRGSTATTVEFSPTRIAVLYFDDHSPDQDLGYLAAGLTDHLIHELQQVSALEVISRSGVKPYKDASAPLDSVVRVLGVGTVVEGSLTRSEDRVSATVRLVKAPELTQMESSVLERSWGEHLAMRNALAERVAEILRRRLGVEIELRRRRAETESDEAWALVRRAEELQGEADELRRAQDTVAMRRALDVADSLLARAESVDEGWLEPIVLRGWVAHDRARSRATTAGQIQWYERAVAHADRALRRDPQHAAALELRGRMRYRLRELSDAAEAERLLELATADLRAAVAVDSSRALAWITLSDLMRQTGRFVEADRAAKRALKADAFLREAEFVVYQLYQTQLELEDLAAADDWCAEARRRFPETYWPWSCGIFLMALPGGPSPDLEKLSAYFESFERAVPSARRDLFRPLVRMHLAAVLARAGRTDSARAVMSAARGEAEAAEPPDPLRRVLYQEAYVRLLLGEPDSALVLLGQYLELNPQRRGYIAEDWLWRSLRNEPRFEALVRTGG